MTFDGLKKPLPCFALCIAGGFIDGDLQIRDFAVHFFRGQHKKTAHENRPFDDGILRTIETFERRMRFTMHAFHAQYGARWVIADFGEAQFGVGERIGETHGWHDARGNCRPVALNAGHAACEDSCIGGEVDDRALCGDHIVERGGRAKRRKNRKAAFEAHAHRRDVRVAIAIGGGDDRLVDHEADVGTKPIEASCAPLARGDVHRDFKAETHIGEAGCRPLHAQFSIR